MNSEIHVARNGTIQRLPLDPRGTPQDITDIIAAVRRLRATGPQPDTIVFIGYRVKGTAKQKKRIRFKNRRLLRHILATAAQGGGFLAPVPMSPAIMGEIHEIRRIAHTPRRYIADEISLRGPSSHERGIWEARAGRKK